MKGMAVRQEDRYPTMEKLVAALDDGDVAPSLTMNILAGTAAVFFLIAVLAIIVGILP